MEFIRISEDGEVTRFDGRKLEALQDAVGGLLCVAPITPAGRIPRSTTAYANDEGLLIGLKYNLLASALCGYHLVGPVVIRATKKVLSEVE